MMEAVICQRLTLVLGLVALAASAAAPPVAAAAAEEAPDLGELKKRLARAIDFRDAAKIRDLLREIGKVNSLAAAKVIAAVTYEVRELDVFDAAVEALAGMDDARVRKFLHNEARRGRNWHVRYLVLEVVARFDDEESRESLVEAALGKSGRVVEHAIGLLGRARKKWAIDALIDILEKANSLTASYAQALLALQEATRKGIDVPADWRKWWDGARESFTFPDPEGKTGDDEVTTVIQRLKERKEAHFFAEMAEGDVLVVKGVFDETQEVLKELEIPHRVLERADLDRMNLSPSSVIVFNCHETEKDRLSVKTIKAVTKFVNDGGYLFTSDWELQNVILRAFPKTIGMSQLTQEHEVKITPSEKNFDHPYLRDVFPKNPYKLANYKWKIDGGSSTLVVPSKGKVYPLVVSAELADLYGGSVVAVTFRHGKGSVLHVLSHFRVQRDATGDGYALQQLLANFIIEKQKWRAQEKAAREKK